MDSGEVLFRNSICNGTQHRKKKNMENILKTIKHFNVVRLKPGKLEEDLRVITKKQTIIWDHYFTK